MIGLITSHLQDVRGQVLATVTETGHWEPFTGEPEPISDNDPESDRDDPVIVVERHGVVKVNLAPSLATWEKVQYSRWTESNKFYFHQLYHNLVQLPPPEASFITTCVIIIKNFCGTSYKWNTELKEQFMEWTNAQIKYVVWNGPNSPWKMWTYLIGTLFFYKTLFCIRTLRLKLTQMLRTC